MIPRMQFRRVLPVIQTGLALSFGGWGLWIRNSILNQRFFGDSTLWDSTARFHVWPWPYKFAVVLNIPAFLIGSALSLPLDVFRPGLPEVVLVIPVLLPIPIVWCLIGAWLDRRARAHQSKSSTEKQWILLFAFVLICAGASSIPERVGGYASYLPAGILVWVTALGLAFVTSRRNKSKTA